MAVVGLSLQLGMTNYINFVYGQCNAAADGRVLSTGLARVHPTS